MQHPTITIENGGLRINDERVFSLWIRLNEMAAGDPVAAWAVAEIRALANTQRAAVEKAAGAAREYGVLREEVGSLHDHRQRVALHESLRAFVLKHGEVLGIVEEGGDS